MSDLSYVRNNNGTYSKLVQLSGSNVEQTLGLAAPSKAIYLGARDNFGNLQGLRTASNDSQNGSTLLANAGMLYNGSTWDGQRSNTEGTLLASAARTATVTSPIQTNYNARGVILSLDITANPGASETLTIAIVSNDVNGKRKALASFPAITSANGTILLVLYPGATETITISGLEVQGLPLPRRWDVNVIHSGTGSWTYSLAHSLVL